MANSTIPVILIIMKDRLTLKHIFIPHEENEYKPHFFREVSIIIILVISIFLLGVSFGSSFFIHKTVLGSSVASSVLIDLTNNSRLAYNEVPLTINPKLQQAALLKGQDMSKYGYFAHESPTGVTPWYWFKQAGYTFLYAGENLAINFTQSNDVESAWMASPKHKENILNVNFREIGIATVDGLYQGNPTTYVVQMFGTPAVESRDYAVTSSKISTTTEVNKNIKSEEITLALNKNVESVKGESTSTPNENSSFGSNFLSIFRTPTLAIVKNTNDLKVVPPEKYVPEAENYSTWYGRALFGSSGYVQMIYKFMIVFIALALIVMIFIEIRRQHPKHIMYGVLMLAILMVFVFINKALIY